MKQIKLLIIVMILLAACAGADVKTAPVQSGQPAVDFTLPDQDGKLWTLSATLRDYHAVVLAFYPKDDTGV